MTYFELDNDDMDIMLLSSQSEIVGSRVDIPAVNI